MSYTTMFCVALVAVLLLYGKSPYGRDATDQQGWFSKRSGMSLYTDYATGVQYVKGGLFGGLQVRIDKDGKPINIYDKE